MKKVDGLVFWVGVYLFVLGVAAVGNSLANPETASFLWLSYISLLLIGVGMMWGNSKLIAAQLNIILIPVLVWDLDLIVNFFGGSFLGLTDYFFESSYFVAGKFISLQHLYILPVGVWAIWKLGLKGRDVWKWSWLELAVVWILSFMLGESVENVNCVLRSCFGDFGGVGYYVVWWLGMSGMVWVVNWMLVRVLGKNNFNKR